MQPFPADIHAEGRRHTVQRKPLPHLLGIVCLALEETQKKEKGEKKSPWG
jgi:hypothetical protein